MTARWYKVGLRADGCRIELDGNRCTLGVFTFRVVQAASPESAVQKALRRVARRLKAATLNPPSSPPRLRVVEIALARKPAKGAPEPGLLWFDGG